MSQANIMSQSINRREFLRTAAGSGAVLATLRQRSPAQAVRRKPNILVMLSDAHAAWL
jgi:hypothetical protein